MLCRAKEDYEYGTCRPREQLAHLELPILGNCSVRLRTPILRAPGSEFLHAPFNMASSAARRHPRIDKRRASGGYQAIRQMWRCIQVSRSCKFIASRIGCLTKLR